MPAIPLSVAVPATAATVAYLKARWRLQEDWRFLAALASSQRNFDRRLKKDQANIFYVIENHAKDKRIADKPFLVFEGKTWTFKQMYNMALRYAGWLKSKHNVVQGEFVAIDMMNSPQFLFLVLGIWSLGATPAFINYNLTGTAFVHSVKTSTARLLIIEPEVASKVLTPETKEAISSPTFRNNMFPIDLAILDSSISSSLEYFPPYRAPDSARSGGLARSPAGLISTSGTTGLPKQAIIPWERTSIAGQALGRWMGLRPVTSSHPDRFYTCMPLYHSSAFSVGFVGCMINAVTLIIGRRFSVSNFWNDVTSHDATVIQYVGETLRYLLHAPPKTIPTHKVRMAFGNGLRPDVWDQFRTRFKIPIIAEFYGSTEGAGGTFNWNRNSFSSGAIGANGAIVDLMSTTATAMVEVDWTTESPLRDPVTGLCRRVPRGSVGEYLLKLDEKDIAAKFQGYHGNTKATESKVLRNVLKKGDAYFRTGDVMRHDNQGRIYFVDRIGDTFRWKSENVSTTEVAECLGMHRDVVEANVYGVSIPGYEGRAGCAAILLRESAFDAQGGMKDDTKQNLATWCINSLPRYAVPIFLRVVKESHVTGNNKLVKSALRDQGVDPEKVGQNGDVLYWLRPGSERYEVFGKKEWDGVKGGRVKL